MEVKKSFIQDVTIAVLYSIIVSIILVLGHALLVKVFGIGYEVSTVINIFIKIISVMIGCLVGIRIRSKGIIKGVCVGALYSILSFLIFSLLSKNITLSEIDIFDIIIPILAGMVSSIIAVNKKGRIRA